MLRKVILYTLLVLLIIPVTSHCQDYRSSATINHKEGILNLIDLEEYERLMSLSLDDFDQSGIGFRQHSGDYELVLLLIPQYIMINKLPDNYARNLHWHLGQIHAFNGYEADAISEMKQAYAGGTVYWECYVTGSIAFLEKDLPTLEDALQRLREQDNQMNIEILEKFVKYFDKGYVEAYSAPY